MIVGVPTELKNHEYRVALTPAGARELTSGGHQVLVETGAGNGSRIPDEVYVAAEPPWPASTTCGPAPT